MSLWITPADLGPFADIPPAKAQAMIDDAVASATTHVPELTSAVLSFEQGAQVLAVLRRAILRWNEQGNGAFTQQQATGGPFGQSWTTDTRQKASKGIFWPSEIAELQQIVATGAAGRAFSVDLAVPTSGTVLADRPDLAFQYDSLPEGYQ